MTTPSTINIYHQSGYISFTKQEYQELERKYQLAKMNRTSAESIFFKGKDWDMGYTAIIITYMASVWTA